MTKCPKCGATMLYANCTSEVCDPPRQPTKTAEEFMRHKYDDYRHIDEFAERQIDMRHALWAMQQFAKLHVKAALKAASEQADMDQDYYNSMQEGSMGFIAPKSIINAYHPDNII